MSDTHLLAYRDARSSNSRLIQLMAWWCRKYNRPLKDPLLATYTVEELAYEYFLCVEMEKAGDESVKAEADKIEEDKQREAAAWADAMEKEDEEEIDVSSDEAWMAKEIAKSKELIGDNFGEDLNIEF